MDDERNALKVWKLQQMERAEAEAKKGDRAFRGMVLAVITITLATVAILASNRQSFDQGYEDGYIKGTATGMASLTNAQINRMSYVEGSADAMQQRIDVEVNRAIEELKLNERP